jgi:hypothetical protein
VVADIRSRRRGGASLRAIAAAVGVSTFSVRRALTAPTPEPEQATPTEEPQPQPRPQPRPQPQANAEDGLEVQCCAKGAAGISSTSPTSQ